VVNFEAAQPDAVEITDDKMAGGIRGQTGCSPISNFLKLGNHFGQEARERPVCPQVLGNTRSLHSAQRSALRLVVLRSG
jgi:hypothetical protein